MAIQLLPKTRYILLAVFSMDSWIPTTMMLQPRPQKRTRTPDTDTNEIKNTAAALAVVSLLGMAALTRKK